MLSTMPHSVLDHDARTCCLEAVVMAPSPRILEVYLCADPASMRSSSVSSMPCSHVLDRLRQTLDPLSLLPYVSISWSSGCSVENLGALLELTEGLLEANETRLLTLRTRRSGEAPDKKYHIEGRLTARRLNPASNRV